MLRDYQARAIDQLYEWFKNNQQGNPCMVLPTGSGKSHIVAALCKNAVQQWPSTRILMLSHVKELIEQNAEKMLQHWPNAPLGIYSAGIGKRELGEAITFASIQSVRSKAELIGHIDLIIVDECFTGETRVCTPSGPKRIDQVRCGDVVYNQAGMGVVEATSCRPSFDIYRVETSNGKIIECTANHPFFTSKGWVKAKDLEQGSRLFSKQDMSALWQQFSSLGEIQRGRKLQVGNAGRALEEAKILLREVCKEIEPNIIECASEGENKQEIERDKAQAYKAWRERAIAAFATAGASPCPGRRMGSGGGHKDESGPQERGLPQLLQGGHWQQGDENSDRTGRRKPFNSREAGAGQEKGSETLGIRVVRVSRIKRESATPVYNLQVSGHPSYFAEGVAVHNCHLISHKDEGGYRELLNGLTEINPHIRLVGLTATPWRLGHGRIDEGESRLFHALLEPVTIEELVHKGYLAPLRSKFVDHEMDVSQVKKRGGEFIAGQLEKAVDTDEQTSAIVTETVQRASHCRSILVFASGVQHAEHLADAFNAIGWPSACVTGSTPKGERARLIEQYKAGEIRVLTNAEVLTTGFDAPDTDCVIMARPTMSPVLYVQIAGRGMRLKSHTDHCLVLDFAGNVRRHGPITAVQPPNRKGKGKGDAPVKPCPECGEAVHLSVKQCPDCGYIWPVEQIQKDYKLYQDDIMGVTPLEMEVTDWAWRVHTGYRSGKDMIMVTYYHGFTNAVKEYLTVEHDGRAGAIGVQKLADIATGCNATLSGCDTMQDICDMMAEKSPPDLIRYRKKGKLYDVIEREWN